METGGRVIGRAAAQPRQVKRRRYELAGWEFKPDKQGIRRKRAILRELRTEWFQSKTRGAESVASKPSQSRQQSPLPRTRRLLCRAYWIRRPRDHADRSAGSHSVHVRGFGAPSTAGDRRGSTRV